MNASSSSSSSSSSHHGGDPCGEWFNPVISMITQASSILVISHFFQILLKPFGQAGPVSQILAGFVIGPSGLSRIGPVKNFFFPNFASDYYETMMLYARTIIMFVIGLEMDFPYLIRNLRPANAIALSSTIMCGLFAAAMTSFIHEETNSHGSPTLLWLVITVILANTASPVMFRVAVDLKVANSEVGRMAICSSLIGDVYAVVLMVIVSKKRTYKNFTWFFLPFFYFMLVVGVIFLNARLVAWMNRRHSNKKYLTNAEVFGLLAILYATAMILETIGLSSILGCLLIGAMFPRGGKAARTLSIKLPYSVNTFILPVYFGYSGFRADVTSINTLAKAGVIFVVILLSIGGKITGTLIACSHLKIPLNEGVLISFLMNLKGHIDILTLNVSLSDKVIINRDVFNLMIPAVVINTLIWGPIISVVVKKENDIMEFKHIPFESQNTSSELRLLACVHSPRPVANMVALIAASRGSDTVPITPYLMHLIELPEKTKTNLLYNQLEADELSDDDDYGGNDVLQINEAVDYFTDETGIMIHQIKLVSPYLSMYLDVCEFALEIRTSIIILPFHKHQRIDGKLESGKEGIRTTNQKVLRNAPCTVAILVDRGFTVSNSSYTSTNESSFHHVATLFFGGPDDREALGFSKRLGQHHHVNLTVIRFLQPPSDSEEDQIGVNISHKDKDVLMAIPDLENDSDTAALTDFYNRHVTAGHVGFVEKQVSNGLETASALRDMVGMYSMFIVGQGGRRNSPLTTGMSDWEECPELGTVGDFLASSEFDISGSVLVIQRHRPLNKNDRNVNT